MSAVTQQFEYYLQSAIDRDASDIHIKAGKTVIYRINGKLRTVGTKVVTAEEIRIFVETTVPARFRIDWEKNYQVDFSYQLPSGTRFRVNGFTQRGLPGLVFRLVKDTPPTLEQLNHTVEPLRKLCELDNGIVLICGPTGSGKSSTIAGMLNYINANQARHIVTLEDPIEYTYTDEKSVFNQREIGLDTPDFVQGLRAAMRQDPDVILIGEMRDAQSFEIALQAAETGHLVFSTLHASHAQQGVRRLFEFFSRGNEDMMKRQVADSLRAVVVQRLVSNVTSSGRIPVVERFVVDAVGRRVIYEGTFEKILPMIESGEENGSISFNRDLYRLVKEGRITRTEALAHSPNRGQLEMNLKGIFLSSGQIIGG